MVKHMYLGIMGIYMYFRLLRCIIWKIWLTHVFRYNGYLHVYLPFKVHHMKLKDSRMKMMNEVLAGIKVLKFYAWENAFREKIKDIRKKELTVLRKCLFYDSAVNFIWQITPYMVGYCTLHRLYLLLFKLSNS